MLMLGLSCVFAVLFFILFAATKRTKVKTIIALLFAALFSVSLGLSIANECFHFGMEKQTTTTTYQLESVNNKKTLPIKFLLAQPVDKSGNKVYAYRLSNKAKVRKTDVDASIHNKVVRTNQSNAVLKQSITIYTYKNKWAKYLFKFPSDEIEKVKTVNTFYIGKDWVVVTPTQLKQLGQSMKAMNTPEAKQQMKKAVEEKVKTEVEAKAQAGETISEDQKKVLMQQAMQDYMQAQLQQLLKEKGIK